MNLLSRMLSEKKIRVVGMDAAVVQCLVFHGLFNIRLDMIERMLGDDVTEQIL